MRTWLLTVAVLLVAAIGRADSFQGLSYETGGEVVAGRWTSQYSKAKDLSRKTNAPMVVVWASPSCGYCKSFASAVSGSSVANWARTHGYLLVFALGTDTADASAAKSFAKGGVLSNYPFVGVWWPKDETGKEVKRQFTGRNGTMLSAAGALARQFMDSVDLLAGAYDGAGGALPPEKRLYLLSASVSPSGTGTVGGAGAYATGKSVTLRATAAKDYVLGGWYLGATRVSQEPSLVVKTTSAAQSYVAKFIRKSADSVAVSFKGVPASGEFEPRAEIAPVALEVTAGSRPTLKVSGLPAGLKFTAKEIAGHAANTIYGTPSRSGLFTVGVKATTLGGAAVTKTLPLVVRGAGERIVAPVAANAGGKVSGGGVFADGRKASVRASALSQHCFAGWYLDGSLVSRNASWSYPVGGRDVELVADFATKAVDLASVRLALQGARQNVAVPAKRVFRCGVATNETVVAEAKSGVSVSASGLPSGLKLVKTRVDADLKEYACRIAGVPTSPSRTDPKTGLPKPTVAKVKVATLGGSSATFAVETVVRPLPAGAFGTFAGVASEDGALAGLGVASLTVSAAGSISGKFALGGTNWTFSATGYTNGVVSADERDWRFVIAAVAKASRQTRPVELVVTPGALACSWAEGGGEDFVLALRRNVWKDKPALPSPKREKASLADFGQPDLTLAVSAAGQATFAGRLEDGTRVSSVSTVCFDEDGRLCAELVVPAKKGVTPRRLVFPLSP